MKKLEHLTEPELSGLLKSMAKKIEDVAQSRGLERPLFALVLFNDPKVGQYIGNCERADIIKALRETANRLERRQDIPR
jgi:hypothetical protein